jgi:hypothetical protein
MVAIYFLAAIGAAYTGCLVIICLKTLAKNHKDRPGTKRALDLIRWVGRLYGS